MHEIGHVVGLHHQHNRWDRDQAVHINWHNLVHGSQSYFRRQAFPLSGVPYDYTSIMQYNIWVSVFFLVLDADGRGSRSCLILIHTVYDAVRRSHNELPPFASRDLSTLFLTRHTMVNDIDTTRTTLMHTESAALQQQCVRKECNGDTGSGAAAASGKDDRTQLSGPTLR